MPRVPIFLLASALLPASLAAQTVSPPVAWEDTPDVHLNLPAAAAMAGAVQAPMAMPAPVHAMAPPPMPVAARPMPPMHHAPSHLGWGPQGGGGGFHHPHMGRGGRVGRFWWGPNVQIRNYGLYGLYPPAGGERWVRYYDDALLVDGGGYVRDGRYGLDWGRYGEPWGDQGGIPVYAGNGDFRPDRGDYAYGDEQGPPPPMPGPPPEAMAPPPTGVEGPPPMRRFQLRAEPRPDCYRQRVVAAPPPVYPAPAFERGYPPGTVITETVTITPPRVITRTYYVRQVVRTKRVRRAPPPIPYGERG